MRRDEVASFSKKAAGIYLEINRQNIPSKKHDLIIGLLGGIKC